MFRNKNREEWKNILKKIKEEWPLAPLFEPSPQHDFTSSNDDIIKGLQKWKEITTTPTSGRHLGIYKVITQPNSEEADTDIQQALTTIISSTLNLAIKKQYCTPEMDESYVDSSSQR